MQKLLQISPGICAAVIIMLFAVFLYLHFIPAIAVGDAHGLLGTGKLDRKREANLESVRGEAAIHWRSLLPLL